MTGFRSTGRPEGLLPVRYASRQKRRAASTQRHHRGAPASGFKRSITERRNIVRAAQYSPYRFALDADAAAVDDSQRLQAAFPGLLQVSLHNALYVLRRDAMKIQNIGHVDPNRFLVMHTVIGVQLKCMP
jgi:hypothetical protein